MSRFADPTVLSFHESLLRESDVALLQGPHWLNDHIISFYLEYLDMVVFKDDTDMLFISTEVTQCMKIVSDTEINAFLDPLDAVNKSIIFFPLNDNENDRVGGSHWSLLVFSKPEQTFYHFDSLSPSNKIHCEKFIRKIKSYLNVGTVRLRDANCLKQTNGYDCGIHVLCNAENVANHVISRGSVDGVFNVTKDEVEGKRDEILDIIKKLATEQ